MIMDAGRLASPFGMAHRPACSLAQGAGQQPHGGSREVGVPQALGWPWGPVPRAGVGHEPQKYTGIHASSALTGARRDINSYSLTEGVSDACPHPGKLRWARQSRGLLGCWGPMCLCLPHSWLAHTCTLALSTRPVLAGRSPLI